ncbi:AN1-like Zinc finger [Arabidopsis thaliana x Arabidopsis arenosa]|uniref:AN1-like Zinc finger n=2 Tax=Arabidopsis TaxID=3701 RepID=A0A8T1XQ90_ARASU|nr:AN1-like Zinc finger [Arabidopsis thaliana x Arabidopsis arenosa]KAG7537046.1 AN1-like Zinc finger [Arabidopsis suecica]
MKHECPKGNRGDITEVICLFCDTGVRPNPDEDPNITWDKHVNNNTHCDPSRAVKKKKQCPVPRCKEVLTFSYTITCRDCCIDHCLKHRFGPDHSCSGPKTPESRVSSTNTTVAATSAPASSSSSSISSASLLAPLSLEARIRNRRLNRTREDEDPRVVQIPLWMIREGLDDLVREPRGQMSQEEEDVEWEEE